MALLEQVAGRFDAGLMQLTTPEHKESVSGGFLSRPFRMSLGRQSSSTCADPSQ